MAQESPSNLIYSQALQSIKDLQKKYVANRNKDSNAIGQAINDTLTKFVQQAGKAMTQYEPVVMSEPPLSRKQNRFWNSLQGDINLLQDELDVLNAATVFMFNFHKIDILQAQMENGKLQNKIKTLELYSSVNDNSLTYFGDTFITGDLIDWNQVSESQRATLVASGHVALGLKQQSNALNATTTKITVLNGSNGFFGNNQEVEDPATTDVNPVTGQKAYKFKAETYKGNLPRSILDDKPNTWFEFEKYLVDPADRSAASNYNFEYALTNTAASAYLVDTGSNLNQQVTAKVNWADGVANDTLRLLFEVDLTVSKNVNLITLLPFGLVDNKNNPIKVVKVTTSLDGTDWQVLGPESVWISNSIDKKISTLSNENVLIGSAAWVTNGDAIQYIRFHIEQPKPVPTSIGHQYFVAKLGPAVTTPNYNVITPTSNATDLSYDSDLPYDSGTSFGGSTVAPTVPNDGASQQGSTNTPAMSLTQPAVSDANYRQAGPIPPVDNPQLYLAQKNIVVNDLVQKIEVFNGKRWAIGIRDIGVKANTYQASSTIISKRFDIPGIVDRVALEADISIPDGYDRSINWVKFWISPNDGLTWYQISRIQDDFLDLPEVLSFNDPTPTELREPGVGYFDTTGTVNSLRLKIEITRPEASENSTPIVKSYKLKVIKRT